MKTVVVKQLTTSEKPQHPDVRFIRLASQEVFISKKNCCAPAPKLPARMNNLAQGWLSRLKK